MKKLGTSLIILFVLFGLQAQSWELSKDKNGIKVYVKKTEEYRMPASKVTAFIDAPFEDVVEAIFDVKKYTAYVPDCAKIEVLKRTGSNELIYYGLFDTPWPAADRDLVIQLKKIPIPNGVKIDMTNKSNFIEVKESATRIPIYFGFWEIVKSTKGVKVTLEYQTDPGGSVPDWMIQGAATKTPFNMIEGLREFLN